MYKASANGPYSTLICSFIAQQFPRRDALPDGDIVDLLEAELYGTKQVRYGPKPKPESQVMIRDVLRDYIARHRPIPIVVPWGSEKPDGSSVDIAELMALRSMGDLHERISAHYSPGTEIRIRVEDVSAAHLFHWRADAARDEAARYTSDFRRLQSIIGSPTTVAAESDKVNEATFNEAADERLPDFVRAMLDRDADHLRPWGWKGGLNDRMLDYYLDSYRKLYPNNSQRDNVLLMARYFAGASARTMLGLRGDKPEWGGSYIELSFVGPIPGTEGQFGRRVHYRTLPMQYTSNHIPPWRAKGYFDIGDDDSITPKLTTFGSDVNLMQSAVILSDPKTLEFVEIRTDYTVD